MLLRLLIKLAEGYFWVFLLVMVYAAAYYGFIYGIRSTWSKEQLFPELYEDGLRTEDEERDHLRELSKTID